MHRSRIIACCCPAIFVVFAGACATRGSTTNVNSPGEVALDTTAAAARADTTARVDTMTRRDTAMRVDTTTRRDTTMRVDTAVTTPPTPTVATAAVELMVADAPGVGAYVTDATGRAVYIIETADSAAVDCVGPCATDFEPVVGHASVATGATGLEASALGMRALPDGRHQVTYNGKPLYFSRADAAKGDTKGQGTKSYGNARLLMPKK